MISVDAGSAKGYRKARPGGDFRKLLDNIESFLDARIESGSSLPLLRLSFIEREGWEEERELFREKFSPLADYLCFQSFSPIMERGRLASRMNALKIPQSPESGRKGGRDLTDGGVKADGTTGFPSDGASGFPEVRTSLNPAGGSSDILSDSSSDNPYSQWCSEPFTRMSIFANGDLFPCCSDYGRLSPVGNLRNMTVEEAWNTEAANLARGSGVPRNPACALCQGFFDQAPSPSRDSGKRSESGRAKAFDPDSSSCHDSASDPGAAFDPDASSDPDVTSETLQTAETTSPAARHATLAPGTEDATETDKAQAPGQFPGGNASGDPCGCPQFL
jgi:hypothetical protein